MDNLIEHQNQQSFRFCYLEDDPLSLTITMKPEKIFNLIYQMPKFIWIDLDNMNMEKMKEEFKTQTEQTLTCTTSIEELIEYIKCSQQSQRISVICDEQIAEEVVDKIQSYIKSQKMKNVIFYGEEYDHEWLPPEVEKKVQSVKSIENVIQEILKFKNYYAEPKEFNNFISVQKQIASSNVLIHTILTMIKQKTNRKQLCYQLLQLGKMIKPGEQSKVEEIISQIQQRPLDIRSAIQLYTSQSFMYGVLNNILRSTTEPTAIYILQPYFCDLFNAIKKLHQQQKKNTDIKEFKCYRGGVISQREFKFFQNNKNSFIQNLGFMSTSRSQNIAGNFVKNVIFEVDAAYIQYPQEVDSPDSGFAFVEDYSIHKSELEVIFNPLNIFQVIEAVIDENIYKVKLKHVVFFTIITKPDQNLNESEKKLKILIQSQIQLNRNYFDMSDLFASSDRYLYGGDQFQQKYLDRALQKGNSYYIFDAYVISGKLHKKRGQYKTFASKMDQAWKFALENFNFEDYEQNYYVSLVKLNEHQATIKNLKQDKQFKLNFKSVLYQKKLIFSQAINTVSPNFPNHYAEFLCKLADSQLSQSNYQQSLKNYLEAQNIFCKIYGQQNQTVIPIIYLRIAKMYLFLNQNESALKYCLKTENLIKTNNDYEYLNLVEIIQFVYLKLGNFKKSQEYSLKMIDLIRKLKGDDNYLLIISLQNLGQVYQKSGDFQKALQYRLLAKGKIQKILISENDVRYLQYLGSCSSLYISLGDFDRALQYGLRHKYFIQENNQLGINYGNSLKLIGKVYFELKDFNRALEYLLKAKNFYLKIFGKSHPLFVEILQNIAVTHFYKKDYKLSLQYNLKVAHFIKKIFGQTHPKYIQTLKNKRAVYFNEIQSLKKNQYQERFNTYKQIKKIEEKLILAQSFDQKYTRISQVKEITNLVKKYKDKKSQKEYRKKIKKLRAVHKRIEEQTLTEQNMSQQEEFEQVFKNGSIIDFICF